MLASFTSTFVGGGAPAHGGITLIMIVVERAMPPALAAAVMTAGPLATPVTRPALSTVARAGLEDNHVVSTAKALPFSSIPLAVSCTAPFTGMLLDGASITMAASTDPLAVGDELTTPINAKTKAVVMQVARFIVMNLVYD